MIEQSGIASTEKVHYAASPLEGGALLRTRAVFDGTGTQTEHTLAHFVGMPADEIRALANATN